jgi:outer membrane protein assembly factor BamB
MPVLATAEDWPTYMHDPGRSAVSGETTLSPANIGGLVKLWSYNTGDVVAASPTVVNNVIYIGSWNGYENAINAVSGQLIWRTFLGTVTPRSDCNPQRTIGVTSSAAVQNGVVYVGGGDDYWYALDANTGNILWKLYIGDSTATGGNTNWSSPLIYGGFAYIGVASFGDCPLVQGKLLKVDLNTHAVVATYNVVPTGTQGGGIWGSPTLDTSTGTIYVTTGTRPLDSQLQAQAIVAVNSADMTLHDYWPLPFPAPILDADFGVTPTLFTDSKGDQRVVAVNKDCIAYAVARNNMTAGTVWQARIGNGGPSPAFGDGCISSGTFANGTLFVAGGIGTANGTNFEGSVNALNPDNGNFIWRHFTPSYVIPALSYLNGMVLAGAGSQFEVLNASNGNVLYSYTTGADIYSPASVSNGRIFVGSGDGNLYAFGLPQTTPPATPTPVPANTPVTVPGTFASFFDNAGTVSDGAATASNFDGYGYSYSKQALATAGITPGGTVTSNGLTFAWPNVAPGNPDNIIAAGQTIALPQPASGTVLAFLGASTSGPSGGTMTVTYTDGSTQQLDLVFSDWALGAVPGAQPAAGNSIVARMPYRDNAAGAQSTLPVYIFYAGFMLQAGKTVKSVTLPATVNGGPVHLFAMAVGTPPGTGPASTPTPQPTSTTGTPSSLPFNNAGTASDGAPSNCNFDGYQFCYSAQALAAAGIRPGGVVVVNGITFTWPQTAPGNPDNVEAAGQTIRLASAPPDAATLAFLGAATTGPSGGPGTITYTDGSTQAFGLALSDWALGANPAAQPIPGNSIAATMSYRDTAAGAKDPKPAYIFYQGIALQPGKTVQSVILPATVNAGPVHIFAIAVGGSGVGGNLATATSTPGQVVVPPPGGGGGTYPPPGGGGAPIGGGGIIVPVMATSTPTPSPTATDTATMVVIPTATPTATAAPPTSTPGEIILAPPPPTWTPTVTPTATPTRIITQTRTRVPALVIHNAPHLAVGGRKISCSSKQNSAQKQQVGCEMVWTKWLPGAEIIYTVSYPNGSRQTFTSMADRTGHTQQVFNVSYVPPAHGKRAPASAIATITVQTVSKDGARAGPVSVRFNIDPVRSVATSGKTAATALPMPKLVVHNAPHLTVGGRSIACSARQNSMKKQQPGCEIVATSWLPGATITYTVSYPNGSRQTVTESADRTGHAVRVFNILYLPLAHGKRSPSPAVATITVRAVSKSGAKAGPVSARFTIVR